MHAKAVLHELPLHLDSLRLVFFENTFKFPTYIICLHIRKVAGWLLIIANVNDSGNGIVVFSDQSNVVNEEHFQPTIVHK